MQLIEGAIRAVLPQLVVGGIIIIGIIKFVDTTWLRWVLLIMSAGGLFYAVYDDIALHVQKEAMKAVKNCVRGKV